jgi:SpoIID/LytB domain protein
MRGYRKALAVAAGAIAVSAALAGPAQATTFTFHGRGWGHGVGMSQWGARGLADAGMTAPQILAHYYTATLVEKKTLPASIRVGLLQERAEIYVQGDGSFDLYDGAGVKRATGTSGERWRVRPNGNRLEVYGPSDTNPRFTTGVPVTVRYEEHSTTVALPQTGYAYKHGRIDIDINASTQKTRAILIVGFEQYLYGLGEMPSSWNTEAIEAQAIAGRTYAYEKFVRLGGNRTICNCTVYATTADQAYVGVKQEVPRWVAAVDGTAGVVVTYGGKPIQAFYSSSSGGFTENNENVFGGEALPYLRGVCDPGDYYGGDNPNGNWTAAYDASDIEQRLQNEGYTTGPIRKIEFPRPRGVSGRVLAVKDADSGGVRVVGTLSDARLSGSAFRSLLDMKSTLILHNIYGAIRLRYDALGCAPGLPTGEEFAWSDITGAVRGRAQNFANGRLFFNSSSGKTFYTKRTILAKYDELREEGVDLGMPTRDELSVAGARASYFERGNIYTSAQTATHEVHGAILAKYLKTGGPDKWGLPISDELSAPGGRSNRFEKARIYWTSAHGAHVVYGAILDRYLELGGGGGKLGLPISDEYATSTGRRTDFEHGFITWNSSTGKTAYKITK